jgi:serine/threonine-protein kinase HipA
MSKKCLYCYQPLAENDHGEYHEQCSLNFFGTKTPPDFAYTLDQMNELAKNVRLTVVGALGGNYIFKPPSAYYPEMPENEHVTMRIAEEAFGLRTVPSSLIRLASGELAYITKRIDRTAKGEKIHMLDMFQILEAFDKYKSSMERVGKAIAAYSGNTLLDQLYYFQLALFSYLTGNNDMHLKNFSMINNRAAWNLSPAYDLLNVAIANPKDEEELALTLEGKKSNFRPEHFRRFAAGLGLVEKQEQNTYAHFLKSKEKALEWLDNSFLSANMKNSYKTLMDKRYTILNQEQIRKAIN